MAIKQLTDYVLQIEGNRTLNEVPKPTESESCPISPRGIYRIVVDGREDLPNCENEGDKIKCSFTYELGWLWDVECGATFVCSKLGGELIFS